ncbi:hypothetical protein NicSoilB4_26550 [Arthrobacter sp. NicSoilB4]|nr:hypothetical protein NicSoilB4_26550 [Arthrobacter sp. NicSoilB4]
MLVGVLATAVLAGCVYEDEGDPRPPEASSSVRPAAALPSKGADLLALETHNYAELEQRLAGAAGQVLLAVSGPADGPGVGFSKSVTVTSAGPHTVTVACVGAPRALISLSQAIVGGIERTDFELDCKGAQSQVVQLKEGSVGAHLIRLHPDGGVWTGAVAGIKISVG